MLVTCTIAAPAAYPAAADATASIGGTWPVHEEIQQPPQKLHGKGIGKGKGRDKGGKRSCIDGDCTIEDTVEAPPAEFGAFKPSWPIVGHGKPRRPAT